MAPPQPVTPRKVMAFFLMHCEGKTHREIGDYFGYNEDWSRKVMDRHDQTGIPLKKPEKNGRKRKFEDEINQCIDRLATEFRTESSKAIAERLQEVGRKEVGRTGDNYGSHKQMWNGNHFPICDVSSHLFQFDSEVSGLSLLQIIALMLRSGVVGNHGTLRSSLQVAQQEAVQAVKGYNWQSQQPTTWIRMNITPVKGQWKARDTT
ncbi:hypothetical protein BV898_05705 [Hypsibius exemplaris]|uniref:Uncharacterized protein n=1 Tax=Hypsibius exemplaris TaxID=2072580 RepID=A0A1W0WYZ3_HYPEX|nr:hypothetical protein BV898_05705 [Hypsibius exemplaris]